MDTPYVFLCDIDFLPSKDMAALLATQLDLLKATEEEEEEEGNRVLVVPALESEHYRATSQPLTKAEVLKLMDLGEILTFRLGLGLPASSGQISIPALLHIKCCQRKSEEKRQDNNTDETRHSNYST